jgi:nucleotide-binding universal stress UspA family protein
MKTIVAAVDFSNATPVVMENAISLAKSFNADLQLFHVIESEPAFITYGFSVAAYPGMASLREETVRRANLLMDELLDKTRKEIPGASSLISDGSPLLELLKHVKQSGADFVVIGSHGHGMLGSLLLGSVAEGMVRKAIVPTLIVPASPE